MTWSDGVGNAGFEAGFASRIIVLHQVFKSRRYGGAIEDEMSDLVFRKATLTDLPEIVAMLADDDLGQSREVVSDPINPAYRAAFERIDRDPNQFLLVMTRQDGRIVGTLQLTFLSHLTHRGATRAQIESVRIARHERGEGLGEKMFQWAIAEARARGCSLVQLTTDQKRPAAHGFYSKLGFTASHLGFKLAL